MAIAVEDRLKSIYEEVMWLANRRPNTPSDTRLWYTPSDARAWYTHIASNSLKKQICRFTGMVSEKAVQEKDYKNLRLEHFKRLQAELTKLVKRHLESGKLDADEFVKLVCDCEQVHIVTFSENYDAMKAKGNYQDAKIKLVKWDKIPPAQQRNIWQNKLRGKVMNANEFEPG